MRAPRHLALALASLLGLTACEAEEVAPGPPRCEPAEELLVERHLKEGFRALADGNAEAAGAAFEKVISLDPGHPEALAGLRSVADGGPTRAEAPTAVTDAGVVLMAGEALAVPVPVNTERYRFEEERARREAARALGLDAPISGSTWYRERTNATGEAVSATDTEAVVGAIDLVVLHDTRTQTARESFVALSAGGGSTHFTIDWDGTVYQNLDLALEANHTKVTASDRRSVSIDLVNPVETRHPPLPGEVGDAKRFDRPLSDFTMIQGTERQTWGYTPAQMRSLSALLRGLVRALPGVAPRIPRGPDGLVPRKALPTGERDAVTGVVGHLHLIGIADDPGAGFDWSQLDWLR